MQFTQHDDWLILETTAGKLFSSWWAGISDLGSLDQARPSALSTVLSGSIVG